MIHPTDLRKRPPRVLPSSFPCSRVCRAAAEPLRRARRYRQQLAYVYYENEPGRRSAAKLLIKNEARRIAAKPPGLLRQCPNTRVLSAFLLTRWDAFVHTCSVTENAVRAPVLTPIFARLRGKGLRRSA
jgi:hypothetical protein